MYQRARKSHDDGEAPSSAQKNLASWYTQGLSDGLGDRLLMFDNSGAPSLELLRFRRDFSQIPGFEAALRDRVNQLGQFRHPAFASVRSIQRLEPEDDLALISNYTEGKRLSEVLRRARGPEYASALIKQLAPALVLLQQHGAGISHGALSPDRIVVSREGRLTIVEHVIGPAIDALDLRPAQLAEAGIPLPPAAHGANPRLDVATDWYQLGLVALSVLVGRPLTRSELEQLENVLDGPGLSPVLRQWLERALQISGNRIESGAEAHAALDELLRKEKPGDSRRLEMRRQAPQVLPLSAPATEIEGDPLEALPREADELDLPPVIPLREPAAEIERGPRLVATNPAPPVRPPAVVPSTFELREPVESAASPRPAPVRSLFDQSFTDRKRTAKRERARDAAQPRAQARPRPRTVVRVRVSSAILAALALIAVVEAMVIIGMVRTIGRPPDSPLLVETNAAGEPVVLSRGATIAPLRVAVAPDLQWVRITSSGSPTVPAGKATTPAPGTLRVSSPIELKIMESSRVLGTVPGAELKLAAGRHEIDLINTTLGYRLRQSVEVEPGQTVSIQVAPPHGLVTIDAAPWAEVSIDGQPAGRTPLGPLPLVPGDHQFSFRHPTGLNDHQRVTVKSDASTRVIGILRR